MKNSKIKYLSINVVILFLLLISLSCNTCKSKSDNDKPEIITDNMIAEAKKSDTPFLADVLSKLKTNPNSVDINAKDPNGVNRNPPSGATALHKATELKNLDIVRALIARGADVNKADNGQFTPLTLAIGTAHMNIGIVNALLEHKDIDINKAGSWGQTPLYLAAEHGHVEVVKALLARPGIEINTRDNDGNTALGIAEIQNRTEIIGLLKAKGASK